MTLDLMITNINDDLKEALVTDGRESDAEILQERYSLLRKLRQIAAALAPVGTVREYLYEGIARNERRFEAVLFDGVSLPDGAMLYAAPVAAAGPSGTVKTQEQK